MPHPERLVAACRFCLLALVCAALAACSEAGPAFVNTDITGAGYGRDFRLSDPDGRERTLADFRGKVVMVFFGFTQCPDVCPTALSRAAEVKALLGADAGHLQVIFVSLDPERDSPVVLRDYTRSFGEDFLGLYTDLEGTRRVAEEFRIFYRKVPTGGSYTMDHSATSYIFDPQGHLRLAVKHEQSAEPIAADIRSLLHDTRSSL